MDIIEAKKHQHKDGQSLSEQPVGVTGVNHQLPFAPSRKGREERRTIMAAMTMTMPFQQMREIDAVEEKITRVNAGLTFSQKMSLIVQAAFSLVHLTAAFNEAVKEQDELIALLSHPAVNNLEPEEYAALAAKLDHIVSGNEQVISSAYLIHFKPWKGTLEQLKDQSDHLSDIAESFRMAADDESLSILSDAVSQVTSNNTEIQGTFVGTVHA